MKTTCWMVAGPCQPTPQGWEAVGERWGEGDGDAAGDGGGELATMEGGEEAFERAAPHPVASSARVTVAGWTLKDRMRAAHAAPPGP